MPCGFLRRLALLLALLPALALTACDTGDSDDKASSPAAEQAAAAETAAPSETKNGAVTAAPQADASAGKNVPRSYLPRQWREMRDEPPAGAEELRRANACLEYANAMTEWMLSKEAGYALWLYVSADHYMRNAALPRLTDRPAAFARTAALRPPADWPEQSAAAIREALAQMDAAVDREREIYRALTDYALDETIVDEGKKGRELLRAISAQWNDYEDARLRIAREVESEARAAEAVTLKGHPLRPQILTVRLFFRRMRDARALLGEQEADAQSLHAWHAELQGILDEAAFLPFAVPGESERLWRAFLRTARKFPDAVAVGLSQGFHPEVRKTLNAAYVEAEKSYNAFAASVR